MDYEERFDEVYDGHNYAILTLVCDGIAVAKVKIKEVPGTGESGTIWARKKNGKWVLNFGMGDEEYDEDEMPNPVKKLIATAGGGPNGNAVAMLTKNMIITSGYMIRPYAEYMKKFNSNKIFGLRVHDKPLPEKLYYEVGKLYLKMLGAPLYL